MNERTAKPWLNCDGVDCGDPFCGGIYDNEGAGILSPLVRSEEEVRTNAEFIVRACNSHEELLEAVGDALQIITFMSGSDDFSETGQAHKGWVKAREKLTRIFATYKKAGGELR